MELKTTVEIPRGLPHVDYNETLLLMGSCFAENTGKLLIDHKFRCNVNPFGILYNPLSIATALRQIMEGKKYTADDLFFYSGLYHSYMHHGSFSSPDAPETLSRINARLEKAGKEISGTGKLLLTFGTAWVYELEETGETVSNCHKLPAGHFRRRRLSVSEIVGVYRPLLEELFGINPACDVVVTVSPIRHIKDGLHANQLSKATLLLATEELMNIFPGKLFYFPSYEIMTDELRDYRFYADDMLHPSPLAIRYIWEIFAKTFFTPATRKIMDECDSIIKALNHRPLHGETEEYKRFLEQIVLKIRRLKEKYPNLDFEKELDLCHTQSNG